MNGDECDILCVSPPCQPFSKARFKSGSTERTGSITSHPMYAVPGDITMRLIEARNPKIILIEEVTAWNHRPADGGVSPMKRFVAWLREKYPHIGIEVLRLDCVPFMAGSRPRLYMGCFKLEVGGHAAAREWVMNAEQILQHRREQGEPTPLTGPTGILTDEVLEKAKSGITHGSRKYEDFFSCSAYQSILVVFRLWHRNAPWTLSCFHPNTLLGSDHSQLELGHCHGA